MKSKKLSVGLIVLVVWLIFSILYVINGEYKRLKNLVYQRGLQDAVVQVLEQASKCQPFPIRYKDTTVQLINFECLQAPEGQPEQPEQPTE